MRKLFYERLVDALKPADQSEWAFFVDQMERSYEALHEAVADATQDEMGRPVFFYSETGAGDGKGSVLVSLHYVEAITGQSKCLNYITTVLLSGTTLSEPKNGVVVDRDFHTGGRDLIKALSLKSNPVRQDPKRIIPRRK